MRKRLFLFDLDGTLLRSDKTISRKTIEEVSRLRANGYLAGVSTSRSEQNCKAFLGELKPDILVVSGGALVKKDNEYIFRAVFSKERTRELIRTARKVCGTSCEITIDTIDRHYWNYKVDPKKQDQSWGDSIWTDFSDFDEEALKMCVEIFDERMASLLAEALSDCDAARFSDGFWYKYTKKGVTKEDSIRVVCNACGLSEEFLPLNRISVSAGRSLLLREKTFIASIRGIKGIVGKTWVTLSGTRKTLVVFHMGNGGT